jgi:DNA-binding NarL/FixJ family response regulator
VENKSQGNKLIYKRSVVIIEDDAFMLSLLTEYLEKSGFIATPVSDAVSAKRIIQAVDPDAVIIDIDLGPGPSGLDIAKSLNTNSNEIGIVFLTNFSDPRFAGHDIKLTQPNAAYLNKNMLKDASVLIDALNAVLLEKDVNKYRFDQRLDRPLANLSSSQIQALRLLAEGKTNQQIADIRKRSLAATESLITRTLETLDISSKSDINARVAAAREFIEKIGLPRTNGSN